MAVDEAREWFSHDVLAVILSSTHSTAAAGSLSFNPETWEASNDFKRVPTSCMKTVNKCCVCVSERRAWGSSFHYSRKPSHLICDDGLLQRLSIQLQETQSFFWRSTATSRRPGKFVRGTGLSSPFACMYVCMYCIYGWMDGWMYVLYLPL